MKKRTVFLRKGFMLTVLAAMLMSVISQLSFVGQASAANATYYVDPAGSDTNNGTSASTPWKTLAKVSATTFGAGDKILLKAGATFTGQLWPKGSGASGNPIVIDRYGTGSNPIVAGGGVDGAVKINNQSYITVQNLEITNQGASAGDYTGVFVYNTSGIMYGIKIANNNIHNVNVSQFAWDRIRGGITVAGTGASNYINDVRIENNTIHDLSWGGIYLNPYIENVPWGKINSVYIGNNTVYNIQGDGIVPGWANAATVEYNVVHDTVMSNTYAFAALWVHNINNGIMQYNEAYNTNAAGGNNDGMAWDFDYGTHNSVYQYNYSHDNVGGWMLDMNDGTDNVMRYNISEDDGTGVSLMEGDPSARLQIYNNTFYTNAARFFGLWGPTRTDTEFKNNIVQKHGSSSMDFTNSQYNGEWTNNIFFGNITNYSTVHGNEYANPKLQYPGTGGNGIGTVDGYKLQYGSPAINAGTAISGNGGKDYWGNSLYGGAPDIGANEYQGTTSTNVALGKPATTSGNCSASEAGAQGSDGDMFTHWCSGGETNWIQIDLGLSFNINRYVVKHAGLVENWGTQSLNTRDFKFQVSTNGTTWTDVDTVTGNAANVTDHAVSASGRYVRLYITNPQTETSNRAARIPEFEVYAATTFDPGQYYKLTNRNSGKVLAISAGSLADGAGALQWTSLNINDQKWKLVQVSATTYELVNANSNQILSIDDGSANDGSNVVQKPDWNAADQRWTITSVGSGYYKIANANSGKLLSIRQASTADGTGAIQWTDTNGLEQQWKIEPAN